MLLYVQWLWVHLWMSLLSKTGQALVVLDMGCADPVFVPVVSRSVDFIVLPHFLV